MRIKLHQYYSNSHTTEFTESIYLHMIKLTQHSLDKLEELLIVAGYTVRNERGNFKSGSCLIESSNIIVLNKFAPVEAKVAYLIDAIQNLPVDENLLDEKNKKFFLQIKQTIIDLSVL